MYTPRRQPRLSFFPLLIFASTSSVSFLSPARVDMPAATGVTGEERLRTEQRPIPLALRRKPGKPACGAISITFYLAILLTRKSFSSLFPLVRSTQQNRETRLDRVRRFRNNVIGSLLSAEEPTPRCCIFTFQSAG